MALRRFATAGARALLVPLLAAGCGSATGLFLELPPEGLGSVGADGGAATSPASVPDGAVPDAPVPGIDAGSNGTDAGPLGSIWNEVEANGTCHGVWTRVSGTSVFGADWADCNVTARLTISVDGDQVSVSRTASSDGNNCQYEGTLVAGSVSGSYTCLNGTYAWSAVITE